MLPLVVALIAAGAALVIRSKLYRLYSDVSPAPSGFGTADSSGNSDNDFSVDIDPDGESDDRDESEAELTGPSDIARYTPDGSFTLETVSRAGMEELSYQEIYARVAPSVVSIMAYSDNAGSYATGVILSEDGYILTNQHVVAGCSAARVVIADNESYDALLVGEDANTDLALLKIDAEGLTPAQFGDSEELVVGDECFAIGNPLSVRYQSTFSNGIISALNRNVEVNGYSMTLLQTTAALNEGSPAGPAHQPLWSGHRHRQHEDYVQHQHGGGSGLLHSLQNRSAGGQCPVRRRRDRPPGHRNHLLCRLRNR